MGRRVDSSLSLRQRLSPLIPGIIQSTIASCGASSLWSACHASSPLQVSMTLYPNLFNIAFSVMRVVASSSAINISMIFPFLLCSKHLLKSVEFCLDAVENPDGLAQILFLACPFQLKGNFFQTYSTYIGGCAIQGMCLKMNDDCIASINGILKGAALFRNILKEYVDNLIIKPGVASQTL